MKNSLLPGSQAPRTSFRSIPGGVWALGFVSLLMDISSEMIHSLLPVFLVSVLGASMASVGWIEGVAEATAAITKVFSGTISDYFRKRKLLALIGYGIAALTKPIFPMATSIREVFAARFIDRVGKGTRGAPRDALVADLTPPEVRGAAYGLRQSLDSVGAFLGPLLALLFMIGTANNIRTVFWIATVPAFCSVAILLLAVREPEHPDAARKARLTLKDSLKMPARYWIVLVVGTIFTLSRFSEAFLVLRARSVGVSIGYVPMVMIVMNVLYAASAYPAGVLSDRWNPRSLLIAGLLVLVASDLVLAAATTSLIAFAGAGLWGLHMGLTQGLFAKLIADTSPPQLRGTAFGVFNLVTGIAILLASVIAGSLWTEFGPRATFLAGAAFASATLLGLLALGRRN